MPSRIGDRRYNPDMNAAARRHARSIALSLFLAAIPCHAQQPTLTADAVLARVRENVADFKKSIPGFVSDESVLSQRFDGDKLNDEMNVDSSFEMKRINDKGETHNPGTSSLVNGKAPKDPEKSRLRIPTAVVTTMSFTLPRTIARTSTFNHLLRKARQSSF